MIRITHILLIAVLSMTVSCVQLANALGVGPGEENQDEQLLAAAVLLALADDGNSCGCQIGDQCFAAGSGVTCSGGSATGTGTLTSTSSSGDFVSIQLGIQMTASGGTVTFNTGASSGDSKQTGIVVRDTTAHQYFANGGGDTSLGGPNASLATTASSTSYCLESHLTEGHVLVRSGGCPSSTIAADGTTDENESFSADSGRTWSIILNNATIDSLVKNSEEKFSG